MFGHSLTHKGKNRSKLNFLAIFSKCFYCMAMKLYLQAYLWYFQMYINHGSPEAIFSSPFWPRKKAKIGQNEDFRLFCKDDTIYQDSCIHMTTTVPAMAAETLHGITLWCRSSNKDSCPMYIPKTGTWSNNSGQYALCDIGCSINVESGGKLIIWYIRL